MGTPWPENQCAHRKGTIEKLIKDQARDTAAQLQILSENPTGDHDGPEKLLVKLLTSFTKSLSHISLCSCEDCECEVTQIPKRVGSPISDQRSENSGEGCKRPAAEDRRGWYKRRKTSKMRMAATNEDGHAWRKYGQKEILQAQFPRSYSLNIPLLEAHLRSISPKTFSDSGSHSRSFSSISISTQYTSSCPSSVASVRQECWGESGDIVQIVRSNTLAILKMKNLKFLKGISEIPDLHLTFMLFNVRGYLRECLMLCKIRGEIGLLKSLTHFDMSKCYSLDHMPKEISNLLQLEVLKGIVVGNSMEKEKDSCTLEHLAKLTKLRKLSIYTKREDFPVISALRDLNRLKKLHKLKIEWGGVSVRKSENITKVDNSSEEMASPELPPQLEELHLKCLPRKSAPDWLRASKRNKIKKLHIEGGPLSDLGQLALQEKSEWQVEILRLKFLKDLEMNWTDLRKLFPKLIYFEKVSCPKLQFFPCDEQGVWKEKANEQF